MEMGIKFLSRHLEMVGQSLSKQMELVSQYLFNHLNHVLNYLFLKSDFLRSNFFLQLEIYQEMIPCIFHRLLYPCKDLLLILLLNSLLLFLLLFINFFTPIKFQLTLLKLELRTIFLLKYKRSIKQKE